MSTLAVLDWDRLLATPDTRWYLDPDEWTGKCFHSDGGCWDCDAPVIAFVEYEICGLPGDAASDQGRSCADLVCADHLPELIAYALDSPGGNPLVADTVVEVGVDPALLRLTGVDPAVQERFNDGALGCAA